MNTNPNVRRPEETQKQYRERLRAMHKEVRGLRVLWDSHMLGTYVRAKHGPLT